MVLGTELGFTEKNQLEHRVWGISETEGTGPHSTLFTLPSQWP